MSVPVHFCFPMFWPTQSRAERPVQSAVSKRVPAVSIWLPTPPPPKRISLPKRRHARPHAGEIVEPLDGPYVRVHLDILKKGLSAQTLARLFALSAEHRAGAQTEFEKKLAVLTGMVRQGELPFDASECERAVFAWRAAGFPPCHHSETFRQAYAPAYRLMKAEYAPLLPLLCELDGRLAQGRRTTLAIDGPCGSGKTTLAALLAQLYDCPVFHADDFFLRPEQRTPERFAQPGGNLDRERLREEVLLPLHEGKPVCYRRFDCHSLSPPAARDRRARHALHRRRKLLPPSRTVAAARRFRLPFCLARIAARPHSRAQRQGDGPALL